MSDIAVKHLIERSTDQQGASGLIVLLQTYKVFTVNFLLQSCSA
jgi:hypothetical protein